MPTATYGVDLAAKPRKTASCVIRWRADGVGVVERPETDVDDDAVMCSMADPGVSTTAIDAPFGWPSPFLDALAEYRAHGRWVDDPGSDSGQDLIRLRDTDRAVKHVTGLTPLSVSSDKIGVVAMRCARLLAARWSTAGVHPDRSGKHAIIEVYPAAALHQWNLSQRAGVEDPGTYKGASAEAAARRVRIFDLLAAAVESCLEFQPDVRDACIGSDDCLDAMICALVARDERGDTIPPPEGSAASVEGWIHLPEKGSLARL